MALLPPSAARDEAVYERPMAHLFREEGRYLSHSIVIDNEGNHGFESRHQGGWLQFLAHDSPVVGSGANSASAQMFWH